MSSGRSVRDKFILVLGSPRVGSLISSREYEKSGRTRLFLRSVLYVFLVFCFFFFAYRVVCCGLMNPKAEFCSELFIL